MHTLMHMRHQPLQMFTQVFVYIWPLLSLLFCMNTFRNMFEVGVYYMLQVLVEDVFIHICEATNL